MIKKYISILVTFALFIISCKNNQTESISNDRILYGTENGYEKKIEETLMDFMGFENVHVNVSIEYENIKSTERKNEVEPISEGLYNVVISESIQESNTTYDNVPSDVDILKLPFIDHNILKNESKVENVRNYTTSETQTVQESIIKKINVISIEVLMKNEISEKSIIEEIIEKMFYGLVPPANIHISIIDNINVVEL